MNETDMNNTDKQKIILDAQNIRYCVKHNTSIKTPRQRNENILLDNVSFQMQQGSMLGIIGPNGAGKSSLLKVIAKLIAPQSGKIKVNDKDYLSFSIKEYAQQIAYLAQSPMVSWALNVEYIVGLAFVHQHKNKHQRDEITHQVMQQCDVWHLRQRLINTLSGGERIRVMLARLLATQAPLLLLDEPLASLDPYHQLVVLKILREYTQSGGSVCLVLHDLNHALNACDQLLLLDKGKLVAQGSPLEVVNGANIQQVYGVQQDIFLRNDKHLIQMYL